MEPIMYELIQRGHYPLTDDAVSLNVPSRPGVYLLSIRLANGVHHTFFTNQTENLYRSLRKYIVKDPAEISEDVFECLLKYRCYFTYFLVPETTYRDEIEKMLRNTIDPLQKLKIVNCN